MSTLLVRNIAHLATFDDEEREIAGGRFTVFDVEDALCEHRSTMKGLHAD